jgi:hypothetical protein
VLLLDWVNDADVDDFGITAKGTELVAARAIAIIEALGRGVRGRRGRDRVAFGCSWVVPAYRVLCLLQRAARSMP